MNTPEPNSLLNLKTKRNPIDNSETNEFESPSKKFKSAETKKTMDLNLKEVKYFIAMLEPKYENIIFTEDKKLTGENLNFKYRKNQAQIMINKIFEKEKCNIKDIEQALEYDNTNKSCIYALLLFNKNENDENKFKENLKKYKYCITQNIKIQDNDKEKNIDLNQLYKIDILMKELEELPGSQKNEVGTLIDLRNSLVEFFTNYHHIADNISYFLPTLNENEINNILTVGLYKNSDNNFKINYRNKEKFSLLKNAIDKLNKDKINENYEEDNDEGDTENGLEKKAEELLESIKNFLGEYLYFEDFNQFQFNQPIDYKNNLTFYYNYIIWSLFVITVDVNESKQIICLKKEKISSYRKLFDLHNLLFDLYFDKEKPFNDIMNYLLQFLLFALSSGRDIDLDNIHEFINLKVKSEFINDEESAKKFQKKLNTKYKLLNAKFIGEKKEIIEFNEKNNFFPETIKINWSNYTNELINTIPKNINWIWECINFESFQNVNFFQIEDINYLKYIIKRILSSKLFKQIFTAFNDVTPVTEYYFNDPENIDDYIERIIFLPYRIQDIRKYGLTDRRLLSILVSGYPEKNITNFNQYRIYRILELCLREIILADHEPCHFIKSAYCIITEGKISRNTSSDKNIDSGSFLEEILFGWKNDKKEPLNLKELNLLKNDIECKNSAILNKKIDLITALKLLDPDIYENDLDNFRNIIFNLSNEDLETFSIPSTADEKYKNYINSVIGIKNIKNLKNCDLSINASMGCSCGYSVEYIRVNHNLDRYDNK